MMMQLYIRNPPEYCRVSWQLAATFINSVKPGDVVKEVSAHEQLLQEFQFQHFEIGPIDQHAAAVIISNVNSELEWADSMRLLSERAYPKNLWDRQGRPPAVQ